GAAVQWLRDELMLIKDAKESEELALKVEDTCEAYVVPAFTGLGAPYWDQYARGVIVGLTRGVNRNHIVRATLEGIAYQVMDVTGVMEDDLKMPIRSIKVDGGASANNFLMQFQADILDKSVERPECVETTALGAAYLAGLCVGYWKDKNEVIKNREINKVFHSRMDKEKRDRLIDGWKKAVEKAKA
nr:glycerol kinase [Lachnospiraceae bacterium]